MRQQLRSLEELTIYIHVDHKNANGTSEQQASGSHVHLHVTYIYSPADQTLPFPLIQT